MEVEASVGVEAKLAEPDDIEPAADLSADLAFLDHRRAARFVPLLGISREHQTDAARLQHALGQVEIAGDVFPPHGMVATAI